MDGINIHACQAKKIDMLGGLVIEPEGFTLFIPSCGA